MIGLEVLAILLLNSLVAGVVLGYFLRSIWDRIKKLEAKLTEKPARTGATKGSYQPAAPIVQPHDPNKSSGVVKPKTPQKLTWEAEEERRKQSLEWGVSGTSQGLKK